MSQPHDEALASIASAVASLESRRKSNPGEFHHQPALSRRPAQSGSGHVELHDLLGGLKSFVSRLEALA
jgi:hypothetical protein